MTLAFQRHRERTLGSPLVVAAEALVALRQVGELWALGVLVGTYWLIYTVNVTEFYGTLNLAGPMALTSILAISCFRIVQRSPIAIWAPLFWFRLACAVYFGFGALVPHVVNDETREHIFALYYFGDALNFKVNFICALGIFSALAFAHIFLRNGKLHPPKAAMASVANVRRRTLAFALGFLLVGGGLRYGLIVPYSFGQVNVVLPGMLLTLARMYYVGLYLLIFYALQYNRKGLLLAAALIAFEILVSIATFAKMELLLVLIFSFLGFISRGVTKKGVVIGASCVLIAYFMFQPLVGYGRIEVAAKYGGDTAGLEERLAIVRSYLEGGYETVDVQSQGGLLRLSYVNANAFVVDRYDAGLPGNTLVDALAVIVPRVLWPDKPIITDLGAELNILVFGSNTSSLGIGHFAEAYWNFGWLGIVFVMAVLALILSLFTRASMNIMARRDWLFLPVVFMGVNMGLRVDGHFVPDILGPGWISLVLGVALWMGRSIVYTLLVPQTRAAERAGRAPDA